MCYKLSLPQFWKGNAEMEGTLGDSICQDKNPQIVQKQWAHLLMSQNSVSDRWSFPAGRKGVKDTADMPQNQVRTVAWNRPSQQRNMRWAQWNEHQWLKQSSTKEVQEKIVGGYSAHESRIEAVNPESRKIPEWHDSISLGQSRAYVTYPGSRAYVTYPGSGEKAWQEQDKLTGTKADSQSRSLHTQDGEEESVGAQ